MPMKCRGDMVHGERRFIVVSWLRLKKQGLAQKNKSKEQVTKKAKIIKHKATNTNDADFYFFGGVNF